LRSVWCAAPSGSDRTAVDRPLGARQPYSINAGDPVCGAGLSGRVFAELLNLVAPSCALDGFLGGRRTSLGSVPGRQMSPSWLAAGLVRPRASRCTHYLPFRPTHLPRCKFRRCDRRLISTAGGHQVRPATAPFTEWVGSTMPPTLRRRLPRLRRGPDGCHG
jgi:hypothetical protein